MNMINTAPALSETDQLRADIYALLAALLRQGCHRRQEEAVL